MADLLDWLSDWDDAEIMWWDVCVDVHQDEEVAAWLIERGLDPWQVSAIGPGGLCRALPVDAPCLPLAHFGRKDQRPWSTSGHRCVFPLWSERGQLVSLRGRYVGENFTPAKSSAALGVPVRGTVMANPLGLSALRGNAQTIVVCEGEPDWLTWSAKRPDLAVLGVLNGSWTPELGRCIAPGSRVAVRTHDDEAGERMAKAVLETLRDGVDGARCRRAA